jgi:hypothetical protein
MKERKAVKLFRLLVIGILSVIVTSCAKKSVELKRPAVAQPIVAVTNPDSLNRRFPFPAPIASKVEEVNEDTAPGPLAEADTVSSQPSVNRALIQAGEIFLQDSATGSKFQLTRTGGNIDTLFVSPNGKYAACMQIVDWTDEPGEYEESETPPKRPIHQVVFLNLISHSTIRVLPPDTVYVFWVFVRWISNSQALIYPSDSFAVDYAYVFDAFRDSLQEVSLLFLTKNRRY